MGFFDPIRLLQNPIFIQKMGFGVWGTIHTIKEWRVISRGNFFILRSIKIKFYRLPLFIPAFIWRICSKPSWVKCLLSLISSATRQKSLKSCNFTPTMGFFEKNGITLQVKSENFSTCNSRISFFFYKYAHNLNIPLNLSLTVHHENVELVKNIIVLETPNDG